MVLNAFYMDKCEVTNAQYCEFLNEKGNLTRDGDTCLNIEDEDCLIERRGGRFVAKPGYADDLAP